MGILVLRNFWFEVVQYAVYILNRSLVIILGDVISDEKWSNYKFLVVYIRVFGCIGFVLVFYEKKIKFDDKSVKCVLMGVSKD